MLSLPTDARLQVDDSRMLSKRSRPSAYLYLLFECLPKPVKLNEFAPMMTVGSMTSTAPGAFHRTVNLTVRKMHVSFC